MALPREGDATMRAGMAGKLKGIAVARDPLAPAGVKRNGSMAKRQPEGQQADEPHRKDTSPRAANRSSRRRHLVYSSRFDTQPVRRAANDRSHPDLGRH